MMDRHMHECLNKGYRLGSIIRVRMVNFLTYDDCEVFPGPRLNVVLGPNGTGKSTLTHAICLACAGSPIHIGRAPELNKFVKNDKIGEECYVEVDILTSNTIHTIKREINAENKSSFWYLDKRKTTETIIKDLMKSLSIDMNNLCSFMPQDRVGRFTRLSSTEILQETLKCIHSNNDVDGEGKTLYDIQQELSRYEDTKLKSQDDRNKKQAEILRLDTQLNQLKGDVDRMNQRQELIKQLEVVKLAEKLFICKEIQTEREQSQRILDDLSTQRAQANDIITPLEANERDLIRQQQRIDRAADTADKAYKSSLNKIKQTKDYAEQLDENIMTTTNELDSISRDRAEQESRLIVARNELRQKEAELGHAEEAIPKIESKLSEIANEMQNLQQQEREYAEARDDIHAQLMQQGNIIKEVTNELNSLKDHHQIFRKQFEKNVYNSRKILEFMDWVDQNKSKFQDEVYGPVGKYLRISDPACAAMVENAIPIKALTSTFIALNNEDGNMLKKQLAGKKLGINVVTLVNLEFPKPQYAIDKDRFRHIGMQGYLIEQIKCPEPILAYLHMNLSLQNVLWCRLDLSRQSLRLEDVNEISLNRLYVDNIQASSSSRRQSSSSATLDITSYNGTRSKYGHKKVSISTDHVRPRDILTSSETNDDSDEIKLALVRRQQDAKHKQGEYSKQIDEINDKLNRIRENIKRIRDQRTKLQTALKHPQNIKPKVDNARRRVREIDRTLSSDVNEEKRKKIIEYQELIQEFQSNLMSMNDHGKLVLQLQLQLMLADDAKTQLHQQIIQARKAIDDAKAGLRDLNRNIDQIKERLIAVDTRMKRIEIELREQEVTLGIDEFNRMMEEVLTLETTQQIHNVATAQDRIEYLELQLARNVDNPAVMQRYNEIKRAHEIANQEYQALEQNFLGLEENLRKRSSSWLDDVENLRRKLNMRFGEYMEELKFKGEVELIKQGKISEYAMQMKVAFKDDGVVSNLSGFRHSGGERNVSTIMYLMALQNETTAPFRIVDEINQGMDERNERLVCDRIVRNCCGSNRSPQYFLITPKLLEALQALDNDDITVLVIFNGPGAAVKWDIPSFIQSLTQQYRHLLTDDIKEEKYAKKASHYDTDDDEVAYVSPVGKKRHTSDAMSSGFRSVEESKRSRVY